MRYLIQDGDKIKKAVMEGLEEVEEMNFAGDGTDYLPDIIGKFNKTVNMNHEDDLGDKKICSYKLVGFKDIDSLGVK